MSCARSPVCALRTIVLLALGLLAAAVSAAGEQPASDAAQVETGRRIYEDGVLPDGSPLQAVRPEGFVFDGEHAACVICHRPSGMGTVEGSIEGTILVPPIAGPVLFAPARFNGTYLDPLHHWVPNAAWARALTRGPYDTASLGRALRKGVDPDDHSLVAPMPRYALDDQAVSALAAYLRQLSSQQATGVEANALHLATVVTPDAPEGEADAVLPVLQAWSATSKASGSHWKLHVWELSGPPDGWEAQLDAFYRERPVFAVLSGVGGADWTPVHRFCEANRVPCVLPVVEVAPDDEPDQYALYFSPGVSLEARMLATHLNREATGDGGAPRAVVQVFGDPPGQRAAKTLASGLNKDAGQAAERRYRLTAPTAALDRLDPKGILVLWLRTPEIEQLVESLPQGPEADTIYLSSFLAPPQATPLPPAWKDRVIYLSLFDDLGLQGEMAKLRLRRWLAQHHIPAAQDLRGQADAYAACYLFSRAIREIRSQEVRRPPIPLSREHVLEMLETVVDKYSDGTDLIDQDSHVAFYGRMSLGPGQRMAVRGGTLLRYRTPESDELVAIGERIVP